MFEKTFLTNIYYCDCLGLQNICILLYLFNTIYTLEVSVSNVENFIF